MKSETLLKVIDEGLQLLADWGGPPSGDDVCRFLLCIALQESGPDLTARYQGSPASTPGPAKGFWQFEAAGGCAGVLSHSATADLAQKLCDEYSVIAEQDAVWRALEGHDLLAAGFARLLIYTDLGPIPQTAPDGWDTYVRIWKPGAPRPDDWPANWATADATVLGSI